MKSLLCKIGWHKWTPWGETMIATFSGIFYKQEKQGYVQFRHCVRCNKQEYHSI